MIILISGKRKSGKDYIAERLRDTFAADSRIIRLSAPLKSAYAKENGLDYQELLSSGPYKEKHRRAMIEWGEEKRNQDPGYFCRLAWGDTGGEKIVIVADCRRKTDFDHFQHQQSCLTVRVKASESTRATRGFTFQPGVDDAESECGLDLVEHDFTLVNEEGDKSNFDKLIELIKSRV